MTDPTVSGNHISENLKEPYTVPLVEEDVLACVSPAGDVINSAFVFYSQWPCHNGVRVAQMASKVKV
jgi:hypothetical protein